MDHSGTRKVLVRLCKAALHRGNRALLKAIYHGRQAAADIRTSRAVCWLSNQLPMLAVVFLALVITGINMVIRTVEASDPAIDGSSLDQAVVGIYADTDSVVAMQYRSLDPLATPPEIRWTLEFVPGEVVEMSATLVMMSGPQLWAIDIDNPLTIVAILPRGARWSPMTSGIMPDGRNCASWYDGRDLKLAHPVFHNTYDGSVALVCKVPAVGKVRQLNFDLRVRYRDTTRQTFSFGRTQSGMRLAHSWQPDSDLSEKGLTYMLSQPTEVSMKLPAGTKLSEAFPEPTGGEAGFRSWRMRNYLVETSGDDIQGEDITYRLEEPQRRVWIQPALDLSMLLAGVMFGLAPSFHRRPRPQGTS